MADSAEMFWTTERPTVPGWYWIRGGYRRPVEFRIVDGELVDEDGAATRFYEPGTEWAGPLPEPRSRPTRKHPARTR